MKKKTEDPYVTVNDVVGIQVRTILGYRDEAVAWANWLQTYTPNRGANKHVQLWQRMIAHDQRLIIGGPHTLDELEHEFSNREPIEFEARAVDYFHMLFPPLCSARQPFALPRQMLTPGTLCSALHRAKELLKIKRFLAQPPTEWPETKIFRKERLYENRLLTEPTFIAAIDKLRKDHAAEIAALQRPVIVNTEVPHPDDDELLDNQDQGPNDDNTLGFDTHIRNPFLYNVMVLCGDWSLRGLTADMKPLAERFQISVERTALYIKVPNYMKIDWRRDVPKDVVELLQERGHFLSAVGPIRLQEWASNWGCSGERILAAYDKFKTRQQAAGWNKSKVLDMVAEQENITRAEGPDDRRRVVRRCLERARRRQLRTH